ncbi:MAG: uracil-xanthine permease [Lachnospiraceae bacterium]|nr:uracil-xanthine permease [Lachnospiraceae bacterium]
MKLKYDINDKPPISSAIILAFQQMLTILAATIAVPMIVGNGLTPAASMFGAGVGTIVYQSMTKYKSPVFLGSSFSFLGSMMAAFAGGVSMTLGFLGLIIGAAFAGLVYVILALIVKKIGVKWISKAMPPVVIGPTVSVIGLSLAGNAISNMRTGNVKVLTAAGDLVPMADENIAILCGIVTLFVTIICSVYGGRTLKFIPFLVGILAGYVFSAILTAIGNSMGMDALKILDFSLLINAIMPGGSISISSFISLPDFVFIKAISGFNELSLSYVITIFTAYVPVAFVGFAEHLADHKNLSSIIGKDLFEDPGLDRTLLGDGLGSVAGAFFGGCPNTTYGESIACVALTRNAATITTFFAAVGCMLLSFVTPFVAFINSVPSCVMGGLCVVPYGYIAVSGLKMFKEIDLEDNRNIFVISVILIVGIGGMTLKFGAVTITEVAAALIFGVIVNLLVGKHASSGQ